MGIAALIAGITIGVSVTVFEPPFLPARGAAAGYEYHLWRWEADTLTSNDVARLGIGHRADLESSAEAVRRYFKLTSQLRAAEASANPDLALVEALASERATYENDVERLIESYVEEAIGKANLRERLPLFNSVSVTWPPVDLELTSPPQLLVRSPRDHIERAGDTLLRTDLTLRQIQEIERKADSEDEVSVVLAIGGLAAYPAIVRDDRTYDSLLNTASHEWVHHYLAFYPLGKQWGKGGDAETLNETTANIAGRELAALIRAAHPLPLPENEDGRAPASAAPTVDFNKVMRQLRLDVDALLASGKVEEAERLMETQRQFLEDNGISIRKINQAYFAFNGTYGDSPSSSSPVGPRAERVWELTKNVGLFLKVMREVETLPDLERAILELEGQKHP